MWPVTLSPSSACLRRIQGTGGARHTIFGIKHLTYTADTAELQVLLQMQSVPPWYYIHITQRAPMGLIQHVFDA